MTKILIPNEALNRHIGFLGSTGSGKTTAAKVAIVEPALHNSERVCIIDPTSAWWGLRLHKDGVKPAHSIYIFGGDHGDYPLRPKDAEALADAFGSSSDSAIFDVQQMTVADRQAFFTSFAQAILRKNRGPLKLIIDEAHLFMPQAGAKSGGAVPAMLNAGNNLVSLGRSRGLRITLISQRPAKLHKDSLSQVQSLVAMRLMAPQDRKAIADWIADQADPQAGRDIIASLPTLKPGEGWVWSPHDNYLERTNFPLPKTFDSSRAPEVGDADAPELKPLDMSALEKRLKHLADEKKANDPAALRAEVARLNAEITRMRNEPRIDDGALHAEFQRGYSSGAQHSYQGMKGPLLGTAEDMEKAAARLREIAKAVQQQAELPLAEPKRNSGPHARFPINAMEAFNAAKPKLIRRANEASGIRLSASPSSALPKGERIVLTAIAQAKVASREQVTVMTGYKRSTRDAYIQRLGEKNFVAAQGDGITATIEGIAALGDFQPLPIGRALLDYHLQRLPSGEALCLSAIVDGATTRESVGAMTEFKRSTRDAYIQRLATRKLIVVNGGTIELSPTLTD